MPNIKVDVLRLPVTGSAEKCGAHVEVGQHGRALSLGPDAERPMLDIDGISEQLGDVVSWLQAALASHGRALYEDPITHTFAVIRLPPRFSEGDKVPPADCSMVRTQEKPLATISDLSDQDEEGQSDDRLN
jgi:hypothetical protein